ncbi:phytanoyl-CoA dioxygenase (PhyH) domain-containing protein [Sarocladium implicatum]|nr:phytanoyl-CoA dioxygenase (PhyH) domain-containing protein [Sarocladium implicatum]
MATPSPYLDQLQRDGFVVIKSILSPDLLANLRTAAQAATDLARTGQWPHVRTVGKQFPPWSAADALTDGIWGVQHLMKPALPGSDLFAKLYFSDEILGVVKQLLKCEDEDLVMELFNMLVKPEKDFELRWHRDDVPAEATAEEELERLGKPAWHAQYNLPLYPDSSLILVPGSHRRARTDVERAASPFEAHIPGQISVDLQPGDIAFYDNNILHRGVYDSSKDRTTLHGSVGHVGGSKQRARNVLQHGVGSWVADVDLAKVGARAEGMRDRLVKMGSDSGDVGYSLQG